MTFWLLGNQNVSQRHKCREEHTETVHRHKHYSSCRDVYSCCHLLAEATGLSHQQVPPAPCLGKWLRRNRVGMGSCSCHVVTCTTLSVVTNSAHQCYYPQKRWTEEGGQWTVYISCKSFFFFSFFIFFFLEFKDIFRVYTGIPGKHYDVHHSELHCLRTKQLKK